MMPPVSAPLHQPRTQEQFFSWASAQEGRYEFDGIRPVAMIRGDAGHSRIMQRLHPALGKRLEGGPCEPLGPDAGIETVNNAIRYPDALITCTPFDPAKRVIPGIVTVFEILNPTSGRIDRIVKVREY
jgi:Uma2 family endonuclease